MLQGGVPYALGKAIPLPAIALGRPAGFPSCTRICCSGRLSFVTPTPTLQATGELRLSCSDPASWDFPEFYGRVSVK